MVDMCYKLFKLSSEQISYQWHKSLKEAKPKSARQSHLERELLSR